MTAKRPRPPKSGAGAPEPRDGLSASAHGAAGAPNRAFKNPIDALPPELRSLMQIAIAPSATSEMQAATASAIVNDAPILALRWFVYHVIRNEFLKGVINAKE